MPTMTGLQATTDVATPATTVDPSIGNQLDIIGLLAHASLPVQLVMVV